jgi:L-threonylcarbamoyladenylate synthase
MNDLGETMKILKASTESARECANYLAAGELVVYPTETVYGLGADATSASSVGKVFLAKRRDTTSAVSVAVGTVAAAWEIAEFNAAAEAIAREFLPGPVTLILRSKVDFKYAVSKGTLGVRVPDDSFFSELWRAFGKPIVSTSANISGARDPLCAADVDGLLLGSVAALVDGGRTRYGRASTTVDVSDGRAKVLREGAVPAERIMAAVAAAGL